jgi:ribosome-associated protein
MIRINDVLAFDEHEIAERFVRATGPHGQNVNRDATAVELRIDLSTSSLPVDVKERLRAVAGRHVTSHDVLVVVSRGFRSQVKNREAARARLVALLDRAANPRRQRTATEPPPAERNQRLERKHRRSAVKGTRNPRLLP